jgi:hypothetical protein
MRYLRTNTATRLTVGPFIDKTDGITPEVALTVTNEKLTFMVDVNGVPTLVLDAAPTASGGANDMIHVSGDDAGFYDLELAAADVNYLGRAMLALTYATEHCPVFHEFMIVPAAVYDALFLGTDNLVAVLTSAYDKAKDDVLTTATAIKNKTDKLPASPAAVGSAMILTSAYDKAKEDVLTPLTAVKAKTDNLPPDPADQSALEAAIAAVEAGGGLDAAGTRAALGLGAANLDTQLSNILAAGGSGSGSITWVYTLLDNGGLPVAGASIWVTSDIDGLNIIASGLTDNFGNVTFYLNAGTVYVWGRKSGFNFTNPDTEEVS